eukprot:COSAG02_NODE_742_length_17794_cov_22.222718_4_plen_82_part_00
MRTIAMIYPFRRHSAVQAPFPPFRRHSCRSGASGAKGEGGGAGLWRLLLTLQQQPPQTGAAAPSGCSFAKHSLFICLWVQY